MSAPDQTDFTGMDSTEGPPDYDPADDLRAARDRRTRELKAALTKMERLRDGIRQHRDTSPGPASDQDVALWALLDE